MLYVQDPGQLSRYNDELEGQSLVPKQGLEISLFSIEFRPALGPTRSPIQWVPGDCFPGVKRPRREADHSPPFNAKVKNGGIIFHSLVSLHGVVIN
jgi:hypothetical protein